MIIIIMSLKNDRQLHEAYNWEKEKIQTGKKVFINYTTNTLNRIGMTNIWIEQLPHDNNNQLKKPTKYLETFSWHFYAKYLSQYAK